MVHRGGRGQSYVYELLYDGKGQDGKPFLMGLLDVETLRRSTATTEDLRGPTPGSQGHLRPILGSSQGDLRARKRRLK